MAATKRNAGLTSAVPRASLNDEELVLINWISSLFYWIIYSNRKHTFIKKHFKHWYIQFQAQHHIIFNHGQPQVQLIVMNAKDCYGESHVKVSDVLNVGWNVMKNAKICSMLIVYKVSLNVMINHSVIIWNVFST